MDWAMITFMLVGNRIDDKINELDELIKYAKEPKEGWGKYIGIGLEISDDVPYLFISVRKYAESADEFNDKKVYFDFDEKNDWPRFASVVALIDREYKAARLMSHRPDEVEENGGN